MTAVSHRLGISSFAFRYAVGTAQFRPPDPLGLPRFIEAARDLGFSRVLLYDNIGSCDFSAATCRDLARRLDQYGLDCELGVRSLTADTLSRYLPLAELLGAQSLRVTVPGADSVAAAVDSARRIFDRDRGRIDRHGVVVAVENHFSLSPDGVERLVESVDHPLVRYICDSTNSICFVEKPEETLARMRGRLYALHLKDYVFRKLEAGYLMDGVALGAGAADIPGLIRQA
ncbi:MAG: TIM barrel protein, partial [Planctomycetes bacterium]|nr:TIM barrel protein [Planctomycetota bacterium]